MKLFLDNCSNYYKFVYQLICLFCLSVLVTNKLLSLTFLEISLLNHFARTLCYIFAFINLCLFLKEKNYKISLIFMLFAVIGLLCKKSSSSSELLQFSLLVFAFSRLKFEKALQVFICTIAVLMITVITSSLLELLDKTNYTFRNGEIRNAFGFTHPNVLGCVLFFLIMSSWAYVKDSFTNNIKIIILLLLTSFFIKYAIDSRTSQYMCLFASFLILISILVSKKNFFSSNIVNSLYKIAFILVFLLNFLLAYFYNSESSFFEYLNNSLSNRLYLYNNAINNLSFTWFGQKLVLYDLDPFSLTSASSAKYQVIDSFYLAFLYNKGLFSIVVYGICYYLLIKKSIEIQNPKIVVVMFCFAIYGITEQYFYLICTNIFIYLVFAFQNKKNRVNPKNCI